MKRFLSLLLSALLVLSCIVGVTAAAPEDTDSKDEITSAEEPEKEQEKDTEASEEDTEEPEKEYTLTYDANIDPDFDIDGEYVIPRSRTVAATEAVTVDKLVHDDALVAEDGNRQYVMKFAGWNTAPNGRGTEYRQGKEILLKSDITLYAVWEYELITAEIEISVAVEEPDGTMAPDDDIFVFTVDSDDSEDVEYIIYGSNGKKVKNGSKELPAEFEIKANQVLVLTAVPGMYTVKQDKTENYDILESYTEEVEVASGEKKSVEFENLYIEPLGMMTVHVIGRVDEPTAYVIRGIDGTNNNIEMTFVIPEGTDKIKLTDLPMGRYRVEYLDSLSYRLEAEDAVRTAEFRHNGDEVNVAFEFTASPLVNWLTAISHYIESFFN